MSSKAKKTTAAASPIGNESKAVNTLTQVNRTFGELSVERQNELAALARYNKHTQALLFHCVCASLGISRQTARTRINAHTGVMHKGNKPSQFDGESFIAEAYKVDAAGNFKAGTLDSYSQLSKFDFYSRDLPQALTQKQASELAVLLAGDFAAKSFDAIKADKVLGQSADKKLAWKAAQKTMVDKLAKLA